MPPRSAPPAVPRPKRLAPARNTAATPEAPPPRPDPAGPDAASPEIPAAAADAPLRGSASSGLARSVVLPAGLHLVATPIGAARDITLRALDTLASADVLAAEDTRTLRHLMDMHGIAVGQRPLVAYHDHNGAAMRPRLLRALAEGRSVAYASEAGTPLVADPGFQLARAAIAAGHPVTSAPGPSAVLAALCVAGLPTDRFLFAGFPPPTRGARQRFLADLSAVPATLVLYESPKRVRETLRDMVQGFGEERAVAVCRELTKRFETVVRGPLATVAAQFAEVPTRGEIVIVIDRAAPAAADAAVVERALLAAMASGSVRDAASGVAAELGLPRRDVYQLALRLAEEGNG